MVKVLRATVYYLVLVGNLEDVDLNTRFKGKLQQDATIEPATMNYRQPTVQFHRMCVGN